jgi:hypothetical protein
MGSVSLSEGNCLGCRQRARTKATAKDLQRIIKEHTRRALELLAQGYGRAAEDWATEAHCVTQELRARREGCDHGGIPFGVCSGCGLDAGTTPAVEAPVQPMPCLGCDEPTCLACGDSGTRHVAVPDEVDPYTCACPAGRASHV